LRSSLRWYSVLLLPSGIIVLAECRRNCHERRLTKKRRRMRDWSFAFFIVTGRRLLRACKVLASLRLSEIVHS
jgi:hypothetical protein